MCNENGFLFDDGVVVRVNNDTFLCHTTSGGSDRVYSWMEEWLQTEWWTLNVFVTNVTEQFSQVAIVGPNARKVLQDVLEQSFSPDDLPFMGMTKVEYQNATLNIYRISFSGELSYEIAVPTKMGLGFWKECLDKGAKYNIQPYGTEALHVMRAEKGFIMIGDETDGTVIPQDLNLDWAVSKAKADFIGKRAHSRSFMVDPKRKKLVGILTEDPEIVLPDGAYAVDGIQNNGKIRTIGHITSTYFSPTLGRSIAMALIEGGLDRVEEIVDFSVDHATVIRARVVDPVFYDPEGEKQNA
jgi:sarcosine oxidase subunit alpha